MDATKTNTCLAWHGGRTGKVINWVENVMHRARMYDVKKLSNLSADFPHFRTAALHLQAHESTFDLLIACSYSRFLLIFLLSVYERTKFMCQ